MPFYCFLVEGVFIGVHSALHLTELTIAPAFFKVVPTTPRSVLKDFIRCSDLSARSEPFLTVSVIRTGLSYGFPVGLG